LYAASQWRLAEYRRAATATILFVFGGISVIFAGPVAVIAFIAIKKLYVREGLGERTVLPGEDKPQN